jgi:anti-sigma factor RsiW
VTEPEYRYLLGRLDEAEREAFAARFLEDPELLARVEEAENDLFDAYASGRLSGDDRRRFEERFLEDAEGRRRLAFARALYRKTRKGGVLQVVGAIAAGVVLLAGVGWLVRRTGTAPPAEPVLAASYRLTAATRGASAPQEVRIPQAGMVEWRTAVPAGTADGAYHVELAGARGDVRWTSAPLEPAGGDLVWQTPAAVVPEGTCVFTIRTGSRAVAYFDVKAVRGSP